MDQAHIFGLLYGLLLASDELILAAVAMLATGLSISVYSLRSLVHGRLVPQAHPRSEKGCIYYFSDLIVP